MIWSEELKREFPDGWECHKIKDLATTYSGGTPLSSKKEYYENGDIPWINSGELNNSFITSTFNYISKCGLDNSSAKLYPSDTILVALYGATAGKVSLLTFEACSNQAVCGVIMNDPNMTNYTRFYLSSLFDYFVLLSTGSARDNISQDTIKNTWIVKPADRVLVSFNLLIKQTTKAVIVNQIENEKLTKQRDEFLPLLMNGQVSVNSDLSQSKLFYFGMYVASCHFGRKTVVASYLIILLMNNPTSIRQWILLTQANAEQLPII